MGYAIIGTRYTTLGGVALELQRRTPRFLHVVEIYIDENGEERVCEITEEQYELLQNERLRISKLDD